MERSWVYGISTKGKTCRDAINSSIQHCHKEMMDRHDSPLKKEKFGGCFVFAIKCHNLKQELNYYNKIDFLDT